MRACAVRLGMVLFCAALAPSAAHGDGGIFVRGDTNGDGALDIGDPVYTLHYLFVSDTACDCLDALDVNDDGKVDIADAVFELSFLFRSGTPPPPPLDRPGPDETPDALTCLRGVEEGTLLSYTPRQCMLDAWETDIERDEIALITAWIESFGGVVHAAYIEPLPFNVCLACGCLRGYSIVVIVSGDKAIEMLALYGFMPIVP
ncbi:MAG TPA: hypothetical protein DCM87_06695 [Planctomycetes bacterium]|nr:hypothetical protein [Planctomycetota bacterium]